MSSSNGVKASDRVESKVCNVSGCGAWKTGDLDFCYHHKGMASNGVPEQNNGRAEKHGLNSDREKWFERHREDVEGKVQLLVESYVEDAPFGFDDDGKVDLLTELCIDQVRLREANEWLRDEFLKEETVTVTDDGRPIKKLVENPAHMPRSRIKRDNIRGLKELGILDDPESEKADTLQDFAEAWEKGLSEQQD